jgi:hypothetical protein
MYSTQCSWTTKRTQKARTGFHSQSRSNMESPTPDLSRENSAKNGIFKEVKNVQPVDVNELKKSSIRFGDTGTFNELSNSFKKRSNMFWTTGQSNLNKTMKKPNNLSPLSKRVNMMKGSLRIGGHQKSQVLGTANSEDFKVGQVSQEIREKDKQVHDFMKKKNVHLGSCSESPNTEAKASFPTYHKDVINGVNVEQFSNSNFKKSIYLSGSPQRERPIQDKYSSYGENIDANNSDALNFSMKNKELKRQLLSHAFNLGYGKDTHKRGPGIDVIQHMRQHSVPLNEHTNLKKKNEKQNFKYSEDIGLRKSKDADFPSSKNHYISGTPAQKLPIDYWKTNFSFNQVSHQTGTGALSNGIADGYVSSLKSSIRSAKAEFAQIKNEVDSKSMIRNKVKANKSSFTVGHSKGDFETSYKQQFLWKVPKVQL